MKLSIKTPLLLLLTLVSFSSAAAFSPCGKSGMRTLRANDGSGFLFYVLREGPDIYFYLAGKQISFPNGTSGPRQFMIDGITYESLSVNPKDFIGAEKGLADLDLLKRHQQYEFAYMKTTPTPLTELVELGPRTKAAAGGQPNFTFFLWMARAPNDPRGTRQYFLTTVSNNEVLVLTAIVPNQAGDDLAMQSFESYASSFQHVLKKEDCPQK